MSKKQNPAAAAAAGGAGSELSGSKPKFATAALAPQPGWSDDELRQLRRQQRDAWPHHAGEGKFRGTETLPSPTLHHASGRGWWLVELADGDKVALRTGSLLSNARFNSECFHQLSRVFARIPSDQWRALLNEALRQLREGGVS